MTKLYHILISKLQIPAIRDIVVVQLSPVSALQIDEIRLDLSNLVAILISLFNVTELDNCMLLANARVLRR